MKVAMQKGSNRCKKSLASFPGPAQLSVACSTEKQERAWNIYHVSDMEGIEKVERT